MNRILLDIQLLLWAAAGDPRLPSSLVERAEDQANRPEFSAASIWEVVIRNGLGRDDSEVEPALPRRGLVDNGYHELPITRAHALSVARLLPLHRDPFDRSLAAQAIHEGIELLTADRLLASYPGLITSVGS